MVVEDVIDQLQLKIVAGEKGLSKKITSGFVGDLLSVVMGKSKEGAIWITIQSHVNIIAVAVLNDLSCIVITEGFEVDQETIAKANEENIPILTTTDSSFNIVKGLLELGL